MTAQATPAHPSDRIQGVYQLPLRIFGDDRGRFTETFRREWFPFVNWDKIQTNRSDSKAGVLRGLHYHHHQVDYWVVLRGTIRAAMVDLRPSSPTYMNSDMVEMGEHNEVGLYIPSGVAHGFVALTDCTLFYIVNNYYDNSDELGVAWNDPVLKLSWGVENPLLSPRDQQNPPLHAIPAEKLPR